jgi:hypothetical protein
MFLYIIQAAKERELAPTLMASTYSRTYGLAQHRQGHGNAVVSSNNNLLNTIPTLKAG